MAGVCTGPGPCDTKPFGTGKNWVNKAGGLPDYIRAVAHGLVRDHGMDETTAISTAVAAVKRWAVGGGNVTAATRARAAKAVAEWEAKKGAAHSLTAAFGATVDLAWDESKHPRVKGKFAPKGSADSSLPPDMAANVRDFQKRNGLPVTGTIDTATAAKIRALTTPGSKGKRGRNGNARAYAKQRQALGQQVSRVNSLAASQRAALRQRMPVPPTGYVWTSTNSLRAAPLTAAQRSAPPVGI